MEKMGTIITQHGGKMNNQKFVVSNQLLQISSFLHSLSTLCQKFPVLLIIACLYSIEVSMTSFSFHISDLSLEFKSKEL